VNTRTIVRTLFWGTITLLTLIGTITVVRWFMTGDIQSPCPVIVHPDHRWDSTNSEIVNVYSCQHPDDVYLQEDGTWLNR
jgi:hypothetical protein